MYPSWGNFGGPQSQNYGGPGPRKQSGGGHAGQGAGFGGFEAPSSGSMFSSLQEQHRQQMQQLQMLHQKQLQSVLNHGNSATTYGGGHPGGHPGGHSGGHSGTSWYPDGSSLSDSSIGAQSYFKQDETPIQPTRGPPTPQQGHQMPPPPPPQPSEPQPAPPPPEPPSVKPLENTGDPKEANKKHSCTTEEDKSLPLQVICLVCVCRHVFILNGISLTLTCPFLSCSQNSQHQYKRTSTFK